LQKTKLLINSHPPINSTISHSTSPTKSWWDDSSAWDFVCACLIICCRSTPPLLTPTMDVFSQHKSRTFSSSPYTMMPFLRDQKTASSTFKHVLFRGNRWDDDWRDLLLAYKSIHTDMHTHNTQHHHLIFRSKETIDLIRGMYISMYLYRSTTTWKSHSSRRRQRKFR